MNIIADNRNLLLAVAFAIATVVGWTFAAGMYRESLAIVQAGERSFNVSLEQVTQYKALFPDQSLANWLGPAQAHVADTQLRRYRRVFAGAVVSCFLTVCFFGLHLEALRADRIVEL
jgi:hypothetical protein